MWALKTRCNLELERKAFLVEVFMCTEAQSWGGWLLGAPEVASTEADQIATMRDASPALCLG